MNYKNKKRGMTLVEVLLVVFISGIVIASITAFGGDIFKYNRIVGNSLSAQQDARQAVKLFLAELRSAEPSENGSFTLGEVQNDSLTFYSDIDHDGDVEQVRYYLSNGILYRATIEPSGTPAVYTGTPNVRTLVKNLMNGATPLFEYFDSSYTGSSSALSQPVNANVVRLVKMNMIIEQDASQAPTPINVTTQVVIRNLKDNL